MEKDTRLMAASLWERLTLGETGLVLMGGAAQDGGVEGHALIISCENSKTATCCWTIDRRMLDPTKKDPPHPIEKETTQKDSRR